MSPPPRRGRVATPAEPPRVWRRSIEKLTRQRERTGDLASRTLYFTFPGGRRASRSQVTFVSPEQVPDFVGEEAWFEMELVAGVPWSWWRAGRQVDPPVPISRPHDEASRRGRAMSPQLSLFDLPPAPREIMPPGFAYRPNLIGAREEDDLVRRFADLDFKPYEHLGYLGNRRVASFGWRRDDQGHMVETGEPIPDFLRPLLDKVAAFTGLARENFRHALVTEYAPGAGIGWHRDRPPAVAIAGVSLVSPCSFRLRRKAGDKWDRATIQAAPRSAYLMSGPARSDWQHSIPPVEALRYSVTFRTVRA